MTTIYTVWLSTNAQYYALPAINSPSAVAYDVLEVNGPKVWLAQRYRPQGGQDTDLRYTHAEFPGIIARWSNEGRWTRGMTRYIEAFSMTFVDIRQDVQVLPFDCRPAGTLPILGTYAATFLKQRRVRKSLWDEIQTRIAAAIADGTTRLYALHALPAGTSEKKEAQ